MGACCSDEKKITSNHAQGVTLAETQKKIKCHAMLQHPKNPHSTNFNVKPVANGIEIVNIYFDNLCHTFMLSNPMPSSQITTFFVKQVKTKSHNILIGVATESIFGTNDAFQHKQAITYSTYSGDIWQKEEGRAGGKKIHDGETVKMTVDTKNWIITWSIENEQLGVSKIAENLKGRELFFVVMMFSKNDTVEIRLV